MSQVFVGRMAIKARQLRAGQAYAVEVKAGQLVQITDLRGKQVADFVAFNLEDQAEYLSTAATRSGNRSIMLQPGMTLLSNRGTPMFELTDDTVGRHDLLLATGDAPQDAGDDEAVQPSSRTTLATVLADYGLSADQMPDPVNWFMHVAIVQRGDLEIRDPLSERNDHVVLTALMDCIVAIAACSSDRIGANGTAPSDLLLRVYR